MGAQDFTTEQVSRTQARYTGRTECFVPEERFKEFKKHGLPREAAYRLDGEDRPEPAELTENEFVVLRADQSTKKTYLGRVEGERIVPLTFQKSRPYGVSPRSAGQYFLQEALMQPAERAPLVIVKGIAGHRQDLLLPGGGAGEGAQPPQRGVPPDPGHPAQRPVRCGDRLSPRR